MSRREVDGKKQEVKGLQACNQGLQACNQRLREEIAGLKQRTEALDQTQLLELELGRLRQENARLRREAEGGGSCAEQLRQEVARLRREAAAAAAAEQQAQAQAAGAAGEGAGGAGAELREEKARLRKLEEVDGNAGGESLRLREENGQLCRDLEAALSKVTALQLRLEERGQQADAVAEFLREMQPHLKSLRTTCEYLSRNVGGLPPPPPLDHRSADRGAAALRELPPFFRYLAELMDAQTSAKRGCLPAKARPSGWFGNGEAFPGCSGR